MHLVSSVGINGNYSKLSNNVELRQSKTINQNNNFDSVSFKSKVISKVANTTKLKNKFLEILLSLLPVAGGLIITNKYDKKLEEKDKIILDLNEKHNELARKMLKNEKFLELPDYKETLMNQDPELTKINVYEKDGKLYQEFCHEYDHYCEPCYRDIDIGYRSHTKTLQEYELDEQGRIIKEKFAKDEFDYYSGKPRSTFYYIKVYDYDKDVVLERNLKVSDKGWDDVSDIYFMEKKPQLPVNIQAVRELTLKKKELSAHLNELESLKQELLECKLEPVKKEAYIFYDTNKQIELQNKIREQEQIIEKLKRELN